MNTQPKCIAAVVVAVLLGAGACAPADTPPDPAAVDAVTLEAMALDESLASHRNLISKIELGGRLINRHLKQPDPAVDQENVARIMCVGQAGLAKYGSQLDAAIAHLREGLAEIGDDASAALLPIADEASTLRERMAGAEREAGGYAELLTGEECTGDETLPQEGDATRPERI